MAAERPPDALVLDVLLAGDDGFTVVDRLRSAGAEIPVLVYSALELGPGQRDRLRLGPTRFLTKAGVSPDQLGEEIERMLGPLV
jgi:CheY-like chemotaxis protein